MKTESTALYVARLAVTLLLITALVAALLAGVNSIPKPAIEALKAQKTQAAIAAGLPGGGEEMNDFPATALVSKVYASDLGYAVEVLPGGFDNTITMMVGIDKFGNILGIDIISHTETAGLGAVADADTPAGVSFREQFIGMNGTVSVSKDGGEVEAITGATFSSLAICVGVNAALDCVAGLG